jgi:hypothetical protein
VAIHGPVRSRAKSPGLSDFYRKLYPRHYDAGFRVLFAASVAAGWAIGVVWELSDGAYALTYAFLAGGIMIVTAVFELPRIKPWRSYLGFCFGALAFTALILVAELLEV